MMAVLLQPVLFKELHHLLGHDHDDAAQCVIIGQETHLHSEEYAPVDCFVCFFHFAPVNFELTEFHVGAPAIPSAREVFFYQNPSTTRTHWHFQLRGPPINIYG